MIWIFVDLVSGWTQAAILRIIWGISRPFWRTIGSFLRISTLNLCTVRLILFSNISLLEALLMSRFLSRCREAVANDPKASKYVDILLSSADYETFVRLMKIMRPVAMSRIPSARAENKVSTGKANQSSKHSDETTEKLSKTWTEEEDEKESYGGNLSTRNDYGPSDAKEGEMSSSKLKRTFK